LEAAASLLVATVGGVSVMVLVPTLWMVAPLGMNVPVIDAPGKKPVVLETEVIVGLR
jgi:hypothetical protein